MKRTEGNDRTDGTTKHYPTDREPKKKVFAPKFVLKPFKTKLAEGMTLRKLEEMMREI
jgi:hypothetical protein